jgi:hypothetical protein
VRDLVKHESTKTKQGYASSTASASSSSVQPATARASDSARQRRREVTLAENFLDTDAPLAMGHRVVPDRSVARPTLARGRDALTRPGVARGSSSPPPFLRRRAARWSKNLGEVGERSETGGGISRCEPTCSGGSFATGVGLSLGRPRGRCRSPTLDHRTRPACLRGKTGRQRRELAPRTAVAESSMRGRDARLQSTAA